MKHKYKLNNCKDITSDPNYKELGPLGLVAVLLQCHSSLFTERMRTTFTAVPKSNMAASNDIGNQN